MFETTVIDEEFSTVNTVNVSLADFEIDHQNRFSCSVNSQIENR